MQFQAGFALAALLLATSNRAAALEASGKVLAFASVRTGVCLFEPRVTIAEAPQQLAAGDALEFDIFVPSACAERAGVEIVFLDGGRTKAPLVEDLGSWRHVRIALDEFALYHMVRFELVARGSLAGEITYRVDNVQLTHAGREPSIVFANALPNGSCIVRDDRRQSGAAVIDFAAAFDGARSLIKHANVTEPWHMYDMANLRRDSDGVPAQQAPFGPTLLGPCVPLSFAERGEYDSIRAQGQKIMFEPLEGGRFYTAWIAYSATNGEALTTRGFAWGNGGERRPLMLHFPKRDDAENPTLDLGPCLLVPIRLASTTPLLGIELPNEPRLRIHALTFQWHRGATTDEPFCTAWLRQQARTPELAVRGMAKPLLRWADNREIAPYFKQDVIDIEAERALFTTLVQGNLDEFQAALSRETERQATCGEPLKRLRITLEDVRDDRDVVRLENGIDPESMLRAFGEQADAGAFVLHCDAAILLQAPQIMAAFGTSAALLESGPRIARWSAPDESSVLVLSPFRVLKDAREFADLPWRQWNTAILLKAAAPELMLAVDGSPQSRADAQSIVKRLSLLSAVPRVGSATSEDFAAESGRALGPECPTFIPGALYPVPDADAPRIADRAPALRRAAHAVSALSVLATPAFMDGSAYPRSAVDELRAAVRALDDTDPKRDADQIVQRAETELARALEIVARGADTRGKGTPIVAFNPLPWSRTTLVQLDSSSGAMFGSNGLPLPSQTTAAGSRIFALEVPSLGYHVVRGSGGDTSAQLDERERVRVDGWTARNNRISFTIDPATGALSSLALVAEKLELLARPAQLAGDGWKTESVAFTEKGPLRAVARVVLSSGERLVELEFRLETRSSLLEVRARTELAGTAFRIPSAHIGPRALFGVPFAAATAVPHPNGQPSRQRIADWAAHTDGNSGIGILAGDLATLLVEKDVLAPELPAGDTTRFALAPFTGGSRQACLAERASEFHSPLALIATDAHEGARTARHSFLSLVRVESLTRRVDGPQSGIIMTAFEPTEEAGTYLLRLAETHGDASTIALEFDRPVFGAELVDLRGTVKRALPVEDRKVEIRMSAHRIETVRVRLRP